ncbi:DUF4394 domain-containing protein [Algoriphagus lacus]|uniref:DUF4394 domain-containing protein n=1 Tax=Algoriphagus lacus TaxID=2056311 RepID=A0A418PML6_9BACT|nr:DUF4394 domain-containing protein [Algoriphagus lacus]RIW12789.1 DUF4394 domain-containing protein [Algoriphagus lacus]
MKKGKINSLGIALILSAMALVSCQDDNAPKVINPGNPPMVNLTALGEDNQLFFFEDGDINFPAETKTLTGLGSGESIISIDYRPATGQLYGLSSASRLYLINENSGVATPLGGGPFTPSIDGMGASIDFNPTVDRIRLVSQTGQNLRLHPETGAVVAVDGTIKGGTNPKISGVAYTNSVSGATSTVLYDIDIEEDILYMQVPPNEGGLQEVGSLGEDFDGATDFDINPDNSIALAVSRTVNQSRLFLIDLSSGNATWVGRFKQDIVSIAFKTNPIAYAADATGKLYRFNPENPQPSMVDFQGLKMGEQILGLDFRPAKGQLLAISNKSQLYVVNPSNGMLTAIGNQLMSMVEGEMVGFDFNPTVDRIRLVTNTGQNLRLHPDLGTVAATDGRLNPGSPMVSGAAYTNNFAGSTTTTLFVIDHATGMLYTQAPPNDGVLVPVGPIGVSVTGQNGFDIGGNSDNAFAVFTIGSSSGVYKINLVSGAATKVSDLNFTPVAMALGLGF